MNKNNKGKEGFSGGASPTLCNKMKKKKDQEKEKKKKNKVKEMEEEKEEKRERVSPIGWCCIMQKTEEEEEGSG